MKPFIMHFSIGRSGHENKILSDTDTLHIEFRAAEVADTKDLDENTLLDLDKTAKFAPSRSTTRANVPK